MSGVDARLVETRTALLNAIEALAPFRSNLIVVGAQAVYMLTGDVPVGLAATTKDSDVVIDPAMLAAEPRLEVAMTKAGFHPNLESSQPGSWINEAGVPVDLLVPEAVGGGGSRGARIPPHDKRAARKVRGLEACLVDKAPRVLKSLEPADSRSFEIDVAGRAALTISKLHKIEDRTNTPHRLNNKDAHDIYRLLRSAESAEISATWNSILDDPVAGETALEAVALLERLFAIGANAIGSQMADNAEPERFVGESVAALAKELLDELKA